MRMFELLPRPLGSIFRKLTHLTCNSRFQGNAVREPTPAVGVAERVGEAAEHLLHLFAPMVVPSISLK